MVASWIGRVYPESADLDIGMTRFSKRLSRIAHLIVGRVVWFVLPRIVRVALSRVDLRGCDLLLRFSYNTLFKKCKIQLFICLETTFHKTFLNFTFLIFFFEIIYCFFVFFEKSLS